MCADESVGSWRGLAAMVDDVHNHLRQGGLDLERHWKTHMWWHCNFAIIFGMLQV